MIFGFNTDIRYGDTVYHVQSEVRQHERVLQTQVFVRGRCIGKRAQPFEDSPPEAEAYEQRLHETLKAQHRQVVEAVREGRIEALFDSPALELKLRWIDAEARVADKLMLLRFCVSLGEQAVVGARVSGRLDAPGLTPVFTEADSTSDGKVELPVNLDRAMLPDATLLVQTCHDGATCRNKFRMRRMIS